MKKIINPFKYTLDNKRYHTLNYHLKKTYGTKVAKVIIDADFSCPNRDGTKGYGGCAFCSLKGSGDSNVALHKSVIEQYQANKEVMNRKWDNGYYIPYFQSFTNTYGPLSKIKAMIEPFLEMDEVCEIALGTRSDCLEQAVVDYLDSITSKKTIWIELGLQTSNDYTSDLMNCCHHFDEFVDALNRLSKTNIKVCVHVMNGLPYETKEDMLQTIKDINHLPFDAIKFHMLHVIKDTKLADIYAVEPFNILTKEEYIDIICDQLELLKPEIIVERVTGDPIKDDLIAPTWTLNKTMVRNDIDKELLRRDSYQGKYYAD